MPPGLSRLYRNGTIGEVKSPKSISRMLRAQCAVSHDDLSREVLSDMFFFDPDYITKIFKKETGMSFKNYVIDKRLTLACKLLTETSEPVHEISLHVGYDNYSYFTRLFKKTYGLTPAEFRTV